MTLIGYSGGGAVAALVAAGREDVEHLITVAGNLDHARWTRERALSPLKGSLNAADVWRDLVEIPQMHFVGTDDDTVDPAIAAAFRARFPPESPVQIETIADFDHHCCWVEQWPELLQRVR